MEKKPRNSKHDRGLTFNMGIIPFHLNINSLHVSTFPGTTDNICPYFPLTILHGYTIQL